VLAHYFETRGWDFKSAAESAGLTSEDLASGMNFVPLGAFARLLDVTRRQPGGAAVLTRLTEDVSGSSSGLVGHLALSAPTVRVFLQSLALFSPLFVTGVEAGYSETGGSGGFYWRMPPGVDAPLDLVALFTASVIVGRVRAACGPGWMPLAVEFEHKAPARLDELERLFGKRLTFNARQSRIHFDTHTLSRPMPSADPHLFELHTHHAQLLMRELAADVDLVSRVTAEVVTRLRNEKLALDEIAYALRLTPRSLQRRLELAGTSFERVLDGARRSVAERLLRETDLQLVQIAFDIGYKSQSTFTRAVKRWLQQTPRAYRQRFRAG
jgi:AraC-like DNA-binding protein